MCFCKLSVFSQTIYFINSYTCIITSEGKKKQHRLLLLVVHLLLCNYSDIQTVTNGHGIHKQFKCYWREVDFRSVSQYSWDVHYPWNRNLLVFLFHFCLFLLLWGRWIRLSFSTCWKYSYKFTFKIVYTCTVFTPRSFHKTIRFSILPLKHV